MTAIRPSLHDFGNTTKGGQVDAFGSTAHASNLLMLILDMDKKEVIEIVKAMAKAAFLSMALIDAYRSVGERKPLAFDASNEKMHYGDIDPIIDICGSLLVGLDEVFDFHIAPVFDEELNEGGQQDANKVKETHEDGGKESGER